jgi:enoyl-[acyl-carrier protein] reductase II
MGTRMLSALESPVHDNWKQAVLTASETDTVLVKRGPAPSMRVLRTEAADTIEDATTALRKLEDLYFGGDMNASLANTGQVAGRIEDIRPVADIIHDTWDGVQAALAAGEARLLGR